MFGLFKKKGKQNKRTFADLKPGDDIIKMVGTQRVVEKISTVRPSMTHTAFRTTESSYLKLPNEFRDKSEYQTYVVPNN